MRSGYTLVQTGRLRSKTGAKTRPGRSDTQRATAARETTYGSSPMASRRQVDTEHRRAPKIQNLYGCKPGNLAIHVSGEGPRYHHYRWPRNSRVLRLYSTKCRCYSERSSRAQAIRALTVADHEGQLLPAYRSHDKHLEQRTSHTKPVSYTHLTLPTNSRV